MPSPSPESPADALPRGGSVWHWLVVALMLAGLDAAASLSSTELLPHAPTLTAGAALAVALVGGTRGVLAGSGTLLWPLLSHATPAAGFQHALPALLSVALGAIASVAPASGRRLGMTLLAACTLQAALVLLRVVATGTTSAGAAVAGAAVGVLLAAAPVLLWRRGPELQRNPAIGLGLGALLATVVGAWQPGPGSAFALLAPLLLIALPLRAGAGGASLLGLALVLVGGALVSHGPARAAWHALPAAPALLLGWSVLMVGGAVFSGRALERLHWQEHRWRLALEDAQIGVAEWHASGRPGFVSERWRELLDDAGGQRSDTQAHWLEQVHEEDRQRAREALLELRTPLQDRWREQLRLKRGTGWDWFDVRIRVASRSRAGAPERLVATLEDVAEQRGAQERQRLSASLFQHLHEGLLITDAQLRVLDLNPTYSQIMGVPRHDMLGSVPGLLSPASDPATRAQQTAMWASLRATGTWRGEMTQQRRNGEPCTLQVTISAVRGNDDQVRYHVLVISDITEQRLQRERLERQAHFDELTRLPNRARLSQMLADAMAASEREGYLLAVCYLDLDHFKPVNDRYGHAAGDRLLVELAQRLRGALRSSAIWSDTAARLGGDEFVLLLRAGTLDEARLAVERVLRVIAQPYVIDGNGELVQITASVGATVFPLDRSDAETLLRHADHAMYGAKQAGRNGYLFFDAESSRRTEERVMAIGRVQGALDQHELVLYFQPKVDMRRGHVLGVEVLLRWAHPEHGLIPPAQFLPLIEQTGLSARVGDWVLEQALEQLVHWQRMGLDLAVSVNVSARHLQEPDFAQRLAELLARHKRPLGPRLELEVLETAALVDVEYTSGLLERCRKLGVRFALDDFGTGYSTLTYLKRLPVDVLKVDRSFVHNMLDDRQDLAIVEGVIGLARTFGCSVVAEGVETPAQARMLIEMGCDIGQGMGIAAPMPAAEVYRWVRDYRGLFSLAAAPSPAPTPVAADAATPHRASPE